VRKKQLAIPIRDRNRVPGSHPAIPVERGSISLHVGLDRDLPTAEAEAAIANAIAIRHERKAAGVENRIRNAVRPTKNAVLSVRVNQVERRDAAAGAGRDKQLQITGGKPQEWL
jgi:hypothetical protein